MNSTNDDIEFLIKWKGFSELENSWCPGFSVRTEDPEAINQFLASHPDHLISALIVRANIAPESVAPSAKKYTFLPNFPTRFLSAGLPVLFVHSRITLVTQFYALYCKKLVLGEAVYG